MRELIRTVRASIFSYDDLDIRDQLFLCEAVAARRNAQCPYSGYAVGAALRAKGQDQIFFGCNVERCTYTQTTHAEQSAIDSMVATLGSRKAVISEIAIVGAPASIEITMPPFDMEDEPVGLVEDVFAPCGHCLQVIWENCGGDPNVRLLGLASNGEVMETTIGDALPMRFGPDKLDVFALEKMR